jgi:predicted permease
MRPLSSTLPPLVTRIVNAGAWLVPVARRRQWQQQWIADLSAQAAFLASDGHAADAIRRDLTRRSTGALRHALWLRLHVWSTLMTLQDLRYAWRGLRSRPGFSVAIILTLGLAIGANATTFSWIDALVLQPLPGVPRANELVMVRFASPTRNTLSFSYPNYLDARAAALPAFTGIAAKDMMAVTMRTETGSPERVWAEVVTGNIFDVLNVRAAHGRMLTVEDERARQPVVVISDTLWRTRFDGAQDVVGRAVNINGAPYTIVGIAPEGFRGAMGGLSMEMWLPVTLHPQLSGRNVLDARGSGWLTALARLTPDATQDTASAQVRTLAERLVADEKITKTWTLRVAPLTEDGAAMVLLPLVSIVMAVVGLVLLIACANVSGLLLARAVARQQELAVRTALGASRWRLIRQLLVESALLAALGGLAGLVIALWASSSINSLLPPLPYPVLIEASVNPRVLAFCAGVVMIATVLFGLAPAFQGSRTYLQSALSASRSGASTPGRARLRRVLVVAQVALAMVLLVSAGLFVRTLVNAYDVDPGFSRRAGVLAEFDLSALNVDETKGAALMDQMIDRLEALPTVARASMATLIPLSVGGSSDTSPGIEGYTPAEGEDVVVFYGVVSRGYFDALGVPLVEGRGIEARDRADSEPVVVINETMARRYWKGRSAIGGRLRATGEWATVIGVARDGKYGQLSEAPRSVMYLPITQVYRSNPTLLVAVNGGAAAAIDDVRKTIAGVAPELAVYDERTLEEHLRMSVAIPKMAAMLLGIFGGLALALAAIGLYGVIAFSVGQRTQEIGVRMALGADRPMIVRQILRQGLTLAAVGLGVGLLVAVVATPLMESQLVNVAPGDPVTFVATAAALLAVAGVAVWIPARRAAHLDPVKALRE